MTKKLLIVWIFVVIPFLSFAQEEIKNNKKKTVFTNKKHEKPCLDSISNPKKTSLLTNLEIPKTNSKDKIITHSGFSFLYNENHEQANWVAYELTKEKTNKLFKRTDQFKSDPKITTESASDNDYLGSGFDRGHLAPAADMSWSYISMSESFYYSNMSPQTPSFNRGIWKKLEELVRKWAIENDTVYVVTGPVLTNDLFSIGPNNVSIPKYYYKVILDYSEPSIKGIGFILPNEGSKEPLQNYAVPIDYVEKLTGIDFYPLIDDEQEEIIEKTLCLECWTWKKNKSKQQ